ncbi:hypothetical protein [Alkaliphilus transvaalensis]|uniref:hypothetical protein n=1 Tax=Alkaliphilus transvaalensis TaxID=114628 RepID=UPI00047E5F9A|nr:hypothetical protein [Alkaliphilus transvaalensis]
MATFEKEVLTLLSTDLFKKILGAGNLPLVQLNAVLALLIKSRIPFDLEYSPGTRRIAAGLNLSIYINPTTTLSFTIPLEEGGTVFNIPT